MFTTRSVVLQAVPVSLIDPPERFLPSPTTPYFVNSNFLLFRCCFPDRIDVRCLFAGRQMECGNHKRGETQLCEIRWKRWCLGTLFLSFIHSFIHSFAPRGTRLDEIFKLPNYFHTGSLFPLIVRFKGKLSSFLARNSPGICLLAAESVELPRLRKNLEEKDEKYSVSCRSIFYQTWNPIFQQETLDMVNHRERATRRNIPSFWFPPNKVYTVVKARYAIVSELYETVKRAGGSNPRK